MKRSLLIYQTVLVLLIAGTARANDVWKGFEFNRSTPADVIATLGEPKRRETESIKIADPNGKITGKRVLPVLVYEKIDGWQKVVLTFQDDRLVKLKFWPKNKSLLASSLPSLYNSDFVSVEGLSSKVPLSVFEGQNEPSVPQVYDTVYFMVSAQADRYFLVQVNNSSWKAFSRQISRTPTVELFPGFVEDVQIVSRGWESKQVDPDVRSKEKRTDP